MPKQKFTSRNVANATCPKGKIRIVLSDNNTLGLTLEVRANGGKTYYARYIDPYGKTRNLKIGDPSSVTLEACIVV